MENNISNQENQVEVTGSNIIFGTSSDDIEEGLHNGQFLEAGLADDKNQIVNEQEQNEIVNPSEEKFNEEKVAEGPTQETTPHSKAETKIIPSLESEDKQDNDETPVVSEEK